MHFGIERKECQEGIEVNQSKATREEHERDATVWSRVVAAEWQRRERLERNSVQDIDS